MDGVGVEGMRRGGESCSGKDEGGGGGREVEETSLPHPLSSLSLSLFFFLIVAHPIVKNLFSSPAFHCRNNQRW